MKKSITKENEELIKFEMFAPFDKRDLELIIKSDVGCAKFLLKDSYTTRSWSYGYMNIDHVKILITLLNNIVDGIENKKESDVASNDMSVL